MCVDGGSGSSSIRMFSLKRRLVVRWWVVAQNNDMDPACVTTYCHKELSGVGTTYCCYSSQQNNQIRLLETEI